MADQNLPLVATKDDVTLRFSLDPKGGVYTVSLRNDGQYSQVFSDRFSDVLEYDRAPASVSLYLKINGDPVPNPLSDYFGRRVEAFNPHDDPESLIFEEKFANDICGSCVIERSFDFQYILDDALDRISRYYTAKRTPTEGLKFRLDIRELEVRMSCWIVLLGNGDSVISTETDWIRLPPDEYASGFLR